MFDELIVVIEMCGRSVSNLMMKYESKSVPGFITLEGWLIFFCLYYLVTEFMLTPDVPLSIFQTKKHLKKNLQVFSTRK